MEFILHLPQDIDKNGDLWQIWSSFCQNLKFFQNSEFQEASYVNESSLLLFAAHDQISSFSSSLKMYNLDLPKLNQLLQVVEQACLPYLILLFERFKYFSLKPEPSDSLDDFAIILRKQTEYCEFGNLKDSMMTNALDSSMKRESLVQHLSNTEGFHFADISVNYNEAQKTYANVSDSNSVGVKTTSCIEKISVNNGLETFGQSNAENHESDDGDTYYELVTNTDDDDVSLFFNKKHRDKLFQRDGASKLANKLSSLNTKQKGKHLAKFHCCFCDKSFVGQLCLRKHLTIKHKGSAKYRCKMCKYEFVNVDEYLLHYENEHFVKQHKPRSLSSIKSKIKKNSWKCDCSVCGGDLVKEGCLQLQYQENQADSYLCWNCGANFPTLIDYKQHCQRHSSKVRFSCDLCQRQLQNIFKLNVHVKNHMVPQNKCDLCGVIFIKPESLARHVKKHTAAPAHICEICGKNFTKETKLQSHMRTHSGEKRYTCELCGKTYAHRNNLVHHKRWHAGELPYECEICGKRTRSSGDLSKHKRKHSDKHPYVCEVCGKGFNYSHTLSRHRLGHSGKRSFGCEVCGRTFIYSEGLRDHIKAQRCPGRRSESGYKRTPKATKLMKMGISSNLMDVVETEVFIPPHVQRTTDSKINDTQDWLYVLRNNETEVAASVLVVSSLY